jgi:hypothetical protein
VCQKILYGHPYTDPNILHFELLEDWPFEVAPEDIPDANDRKLKG